ncbi:hypothetical protein ABIC37_005420 [Priestia megaterium]
MTKLRYNEFAVKDYSIFGELEGKGRWQRSSIIEVR